MPKCWPMLPELPQNWAWYQNYSRLLKMKQNYSDLCGVWIEPAKICALMAGLASSSARPAGRSPRPASWSRGSTKHDVLAVEKFAPWQKRPRRQRASVGKSSAKCCSFSAVSAPIFARKYAFCSIFQNLPDSQAEIFVIWQHFAKFATFTFFCWNFTKIAVFSNRFFAKIWRLQRCKRMQIL